MSSDISIPHQYDPNTPRTTHPGFTAAMYGEVLGSADVVLNLAAGKTDLEADLKSRGYNTSVVSVDPMYASEPGYKGRPNFIPALAQKLPLENNSVDMSVCQFGMQHMGSEMGEAIREMVRVTRPADGPQDTHRGNIFINPVFRPKELQAALRGLGVEGIAYIAEHDRSVTSSVAARKLVRPTLYIRKTDALTPNKLDAIVGAVNGSGALTTRKSLGELASRAFGGHSYM